MTVHRYTLFERNNEIDSFLRQQYSGILYYCSAYLKLIQAYTKCDIQYIVLQNGDNIKGVFPLAFTTNLAHGTVCNSLPFYGSNGSMVMDGTIDKEAANEGRQQMLNEAESLIAEKKCVAATFITNPFDTETNDFLKAKFTYDFVDQRIGQITLFPSTTEDTGESLLRMYEDPRPRNIRKAIKEGVTVRPLSIGETISFLYDTHYQNITAINGLAKERAFFELIDNFFTEENCKVYIAEKDGIWVAALLLFYFNKTVEYFTPATVETYRNLQPASLLIHQAMQDAMKDGYTAWNWGGTWMTQNGVYDFKKKWGTTDFPYFYYTRIYDTTLLALSKEELIGAYPNFFVLPFNQLKSDT